MIYVGERRTWMKSAVTAKAKVERWSKINVKGTGSRERHDILNLCAFSRRGMLRTCAGTRSWEKKWQHEKLVLRPTLKAPTTTRPWGTLLSPPFPTCPQLSSACHTPPYCYESTTAWDTTPRQWEVQMGLGVDKKKQEVIFKKKRKKD